MNYRHAFHAGNFADVFKHVLLTRLFVALQRKPTAFRYIDTHAGLGWYDLDAEDARRGAEWQDGIGRLPAAADGPLQALMEPYLAAVGPRDAAGQPRRYPGSPILAQLSLRPQDRLVVCEAHPVDVIALRAAVSGDRRVTVLSTDGYAALKGLVPPPERRGIVLIDPPFESRMEFDAMLASLAAAHRKWPTGLYALWYPIKNREAVLDFGEALSRSAIPRIAQVELIVQPGALFQGPLAGCGLVLVNPPYGLDQEIAVLLPYLAAVLGRGEPGSWRWRLLTPEGAR